MSEVWQSLKREKSARAQLEADCAVLRSRNAELVEALERIRDELQGANVGQGPILPLTVRVLEITEATLTRSTDRREL